MNIALNVGCHDIHMDGFINIDIDPAMKPDLLWDCTRLQEKFAPGSVDLIYAGHFLEHLVIDVGRQVCRDFHIILKDFGTLVAVVPDYIKAAAYPADVAQMVLLADGQHKAVYNAARLRAFLAEAGFPTITEIALEELKLCAFPAVAWQTCMLALKHPHPQWHGPG